MNVEELKIKLSELLPAAAYEEGGQWLTINIEPAEWLAFAKQLRNDISLNFDFLFCLTCIDWKTHLTMVYHLTSTTHRHNIVVKAKLHFDNPEIASVTSIWKTADFHERAVFQLLQEAGLLDDLISVGDTRGKASIKKVVELTMRNLGKVAGKFMRPAAEKFLLMCAQ